MAIYFPTVTNFNNGIVTIISSDGTPYYQIQNSVGEVRYFLNALYINAGNNEQLSKPILFYRYDANGDAQKFLEVTLIDIYQFQSALNIDMRDKRVVFDGNMYANITLLPLQTLFMNFDVTERKNSDLLPKIDFISTNPFFKQFPNNNNE